MCVCVCVGLRRGRTRRTDPRRRAALPASGRPRARLSPAPRQHAPDGAVSCAGVGVRVRACVYVCVRARVCARAPRQDAADGAAPHGPLLLPRQHPVRCNARWVDEGGGREEGREGGRVRGGGGLVRDKQLPPPPLLSSPLSLFSSFFLPTPSPFPPPHCPSSPPSLPAPAPLYLLSLSLTSLSLRAQRTRPPRLRLSPGLAAAAALLAGPSRPHIY